MLFSLFRAGFKKPVIIIFAAAFLSAVPITYVATAADIYVKKKTTAERYQEDKERREKTQQQFKSEGYQPMPIPQDNSAAAALQQLAPDPKSLCTSEDMRMLNQIDGAALYLQELNSTRNPVITPQAAQWIQFLNNPANAVAVQALYGRCMRELVSAKLMMTYKNVPGINGNPTPNALAPVNPR